MLVKEEDYITIIGIIIVIPGGKSLQSSYKVVLATTASKGVV